MLFPALSNTLPALPAPSLCTVSVEPLVRNRFPAWMEILPLAPCLAEAFTVLHMLWNAPVAVRVTSPAFPALEFEEVLMVLSKAPLLRVRSPALMTMLPPDPED